MNTGGIVRHLVPDHAPAPSPAPSPRHPAVLARPSGRPSRPALLAGEDLDAPDPHVFRGID